MFVAQYTDGSLAGVDYSSGGYPWKAYVPVKGGTLNSVRFWEEESEAHKYCKIFPELTVKRFNFQVLPETTKAPVVLTAAEESSLLKLFELYEMSADHLPEALLKLRLMLNLNKMIKT